MRKRLAVRIAVSLCGGALATALTAWVIAASVELPQHGPKPSAMRWPAPPGEGWPAGPSTGFVSRGLGKVTREWSYDRSERGSATYVWFSCERTSAGWPALAMFCDVRRIVAVPGPDLETTRSGIMRPGWLAAIVDDLKGVQEVAGIKRQSPTSMDLPIRFVWPGFAVNTAFYGTLAFLLWSAPGCARRTRRRRRGLCDACGYELKGMPKCPECGA